MDIGICQICGEAFKLESPDAELICPSCENEDAEEERDAWHAKEW